MRIFGMGMPELIVILIVILIIFGPKNLPKLGAALGKAVKGVREGVDSVTTELDSAKESIDNLEKDDGAKAATSAQDGDDPVTVTAVVEDIPAEPVQAAQAAGSASSAEGDEAGAMGGFCSQCGAGLEADAKFCKKCGAAAS